MVSEVQSNMLSLLPPDLAELAFDLSAVAGSKEYCFPLSAAPAVLKILLVNGVALLGGDLWEFKNGEYYPSGENWYTESVEGELAEIREARVGATARQFFARYANAGDRRVTFVVKSNPAAS
ncbi:hypothetical protein F8271_18170 [Micromonospora sp. ALFpr18c]|uniref:hypothetical protein n=1 Tax=unclassified Micromonospora TaxID=2617518 RepID=UPI00124B6818|nr:hypothetical protein [Micromonospora sp. ALFpr18c]KAB1938167.1 hypothetical protein F8271_18170 [Micromonospora sp. ALFpr18c]